jgi:SAM-dependent methyltransferase
VRAARGGEPGAHTPAPRAPGAGSATSEFGADFYDESFEREGRWKLPYWELQWYGSWTAIAERITAASDDPAVLDMGCGAGHFAALLHDRGVGRFTGFDFSEKRLAYAKTLVPDYDFVVADAYTTDLFTTAEYGTVVCTEFLEHLDRDVEVLQRIRSGARVLGTVPNYDAEAHVRVFPTKDAVVERYGVVLRDIRVDQVHNTTGTAEWLMDGTVR